MTDLSPHFTLEEFTLSQTAARLNIRNDPSAQEYNNLRRVAGVMEKARELLGNRPILVSSGFRAPRVNKAVGGAPTSAHVHGLAVDFTCPSFGSPSEICKVLEPHMQEFGIDQLIHEFKTWVHLGLSATAPRHMALTIDNNGTRSGFA